jgi:hypothetical protein
MKKKKAKYNYKVKTGRKLFDGKNKDIVIQKLERVWAIRGSDVEAAYYAGISPASLCDFLKKNPEVSERKNALKNRPVLKAKEVIINGLDNNPEFSLKYLERVKPDEFGTKSKLEHVGKNGQPLFEKYKDTPEDQIDQKLNKVIEQVKKG